jgi:hypothetical protein
MKEKMYLLEMHNPFIGVVFQFLSLSLPSKGHYATIKV